MEQFYNDTHKKEMAREWDCKLIKNLNNEKYMILTKKFNVIMFTTSLRGDKAFAAD